MGSGTVAVSRRRALPGGWRQLPLAWEGDLDDVPLRANADQLVAIGGE
jgi:hypothetical protein